MGQEVDHTLGDVYAGMNATTGTIQAMAAAMERQSAMATTIQATLMIATEAAHQALRDARAIHHPLHQLDIAATGLMTAIAYFQLTGKDETRHIHCRTIHSWLMTIRLDDLAVGSPGALGFTILVDQAEGLFAPQGFLGIIQILINEQALHTCP